MMPGVIKFIMAALFNSATFVNQLRICSAMYAIVLQHQRFSFDWIFFETNDQYSKVVHRIREVMHI